MRVNPAADEEIIAIAEVKEFVVAVFGRVAGVGCAFLVGDDKVIDEESVGNQRAAEYAAGLEVAKSTWMCEIEESRTQLWR